MEAPHEQQGCERALQELLPLPHSLTPLVTLNTRQQQQQNRAPCKRKATSDRLDDGLALSLVLGLRDDPSALEVFELRQPFLHVAAAAPTRRRHDGRGDNRRRHDGRGNGGTAVNHLRALAGAKEGVAGIEKLLVELPSCSHHRDHGHL